MQANLLGDQFIVRAGGADTPWIPFVEDLYGYRYVEKELLDNNSFGTSADWGVHVLGNLMDNHVGYALSVVNGNGYKIASTGTANRTNAVDVEGRVNVTYDHFTVAVGGYDGKLGKDIAGTPTFHTAERFDVLGAYTDSRVRVGAEYMWARYFNDVLQSNPAMTNSAEGVSAFASWFFTPKFSIFGRYDYLEAPREHQSQSSLRLVQRWFVVQADRTFDLLWSTSTISVLNGLLSTGNAVARSGHSTPI